jgi:hypothetical protein
MKLLGMRGFALMALLASIAPGWAEDVLVVEQDYNLVRPDKEGVGAKDIRQKMYLSKGMVRIDEFGGESKQPTESYLIDLNKRLIVDLDHENLTKLVETFEQRAARIELRKQKVRGDIQALQGPQKEKVEKLYRALLDDDRSFELVQEKGKVEVAGVECKQVKITDSKNPDYEPMVLALHPKKELPYDSAEVLYLLQIIGGNMREFLNQNKGKFKQVPMSMTVDLAAGGMLKVKVIGLEETTTEKLDPTLFEIPDYKNKATLPQVKKDRKVDAGQ